MVKILLVLMISICAFGADVCEMKDIEGLSCDYGYDAMDIRG